MSTDNQEIKQPEVTSQGQIAFDRQDLEDILGFCHITLMAKGLDAIDAVYRVRMKALALLDTTDR